MDVGDLGVLAHRVRRQLDDLVVRVGDLGAGMKAKIARNLLSFAQCAAIYEGMRVAEEAGVDLEAYARIVRHSEAQSNLLDGFLGNTSVREGNDSSEWGRQRLAMAQVVVETAHKDLSAALDLGTSLGLKLPVAEAAHGEVPATWGAEAGPKR